MLGVFVDGRQVGNLGVFTDGDLGRFQLVAVHPDYQKQGVCGTMVFRSASYAFEKMGVKTLVMVADEEYHAAKIYESVGFVPTEKIVGVCWWDKAKG
ncbi:GNAT family N-acetyltransferase [Bdellovibrionota bacterium FG-2]